MKKPRNLIIIAIILVVLIGGGVAAAIVWSHYQAPRGTTNGSGSNTNSSSGSNASTPKAVAQQTANDAETLVYDGNLQAGVQKLNNAIQNTNDTSQQFIYYQQLATILFNNNQLADALTAAKKAYDLNQTSDSAAFVGQIAQQMGDKQTALQYYQYAVNRIDKNDIYAKSDTTYYQGIIASLQGGQ